MRYGKVVRAVFCSRPNRFVAQVDLNGEDISVHVKNTGRCRELLIPGSFVWLEDFEGRMGKRKMRYDLICVEKVTAQGNLLVNMDSQAPNRAVKEAVEDGRVKIKGLGKLAEIRPEKSFGRSRFDFYLKDEAGREAFVEVKGVTLESGGYAAFPDAPTPRGVKHLEELMEARRQGCLAAAVFVIQMEGMEQIEPNDDTDPRFGKTLRAAAEAGVEVLAFECRVGPDSMEIFKAVYVKL